MTITRRISHYLGLTRAEDPPSDGVLPPSRNSVRVVSPDRSLTIPTVYRAVQVHQTAVSQLSLKVERAQAMDSLPSIIRKPSLSLHRSAFLSVTVGAMALHGNAYWLVNRGPNSEVLDITPLDPAQVAVTSTAFGQPRYLHKGKTYTPNDIQHLQLMRLSGHPTGLGPIQAAQVDLAGALDVRDFAGQWFKDSGVPSGVLKTDEPLTSSQVDDYRKRWDETADGGTRVLGHGLNYSPVAISPKDAQWLESQNFTVTQIARLMAVPASLMLANVEGSSETYQNVEQEWIGYVRFSLMSYLREIEEAFTALLPRGQTVRFNVETLLRSDTKSRYEAHQMALTGGWMTVDEVRDIEGLEPLAPAAADLATIPKETQTSA